MKLFAEKYLMVIMTTLKIRDKVIQEIDLIPEDKLVDLFNFIHYFRLGLETSTHHENKPTLAFAGCWREMPDETFSAFMSEITERRHLAFSRRRSGEGSTD
jgi:hypothetical protein